MQSSAKNRIAIIGGIGATLAIFLGSMLFVFRWLAPDVEVAALIGDSFGSINALFSCLAFAGVIIALILQASEFRLAWQERNEALKAQSQIARYQELDTLVAGIQTWSGLHPNRGDKKPSEWSFDDLRYLKMRFINAALLEAALERMQLPTTENERPIRELPAIRVARLRADYAAILGNIIMSQRNWLQDGWEQKGAEEARTFIMTDVRSIRANITEELDKGELGDARKSIPELQTCYTNVMNLCYALEAQIKGREQQTESVGGVFQDRRVSLQLTTDFVTKAIEGASNAMLLEVERLFDPVAMNLLTDEDASESESQDSSNL